MRPQFARRDLGGTLREEHENIMRTVRVIAVALSSVVLAIIVLTFWDQCFVNFVAAEGNISVMAFLIKRGANLNQKCRWNYPLIAAAQARRAEMVSFLLTNGATPNVRDADSSTALIWSAKQNDPEVAVKLIDAGADVNLEDQVGGSALWYAVRSDSYPIVVRLLRAGRIYAEGQVAYFL
jgi:ankyrin repeat protein